MLSGHEVARDIAESKITYTRHAREGGHPACGDAAFIKAHACITCKACGAASPPPARGWCKDNFQFRDNFSARCGQMRTNTVKCGQKQADRAGRKLLTGYKAETILFKNITLSLWGCYPGGIDSEDEVKESQEEKMLEPRKLYNVAAKWHVGPAGQSGLEYACRNDDSVIKDDKETVERLQKTAEQGNADSQVLLGLIYYQGSGVEKNYKEAFKWWHKAAAQNDAEAQYSLGYAYYHGEGVKKDYKEAIKLYRMAATQGYAAAKKFLNDHGYNNRVYAAC